MAVGANHSSEWTRIGLITAAYRKTGLLALNQTLDDDVLLATGVEALNLIIREIDGSEEHLWAEDVESITLVAQQGVYSLTGNVIALIQASYRDASGNDSPMDILDLKGYEAISDKNAIGEPTKIYLPTTRLKTSQTIHVHPLKESVNTQSVVIGTDGNDYKCITNHNASSLNRPVTGANYKLFWEATGGTGAGVTWAASTDYLAPQQVRITYRRPLYDFTATVSNPDMPQVWSRYLLYRLASDLGVGVLPRETIRVLDRKAGQAWSDIFPARVAKTTTYYNKTKFF